MVPLIPSVMCLRGVKCVAHWQRGRTISQLCGFTEWQIKFQRFFVEMMHVLHCVCLHECAFSRRSLCSWLLGVPCCSLFWRCFLMESGIVFGFPSAFQQCTCQVQIAPEHCFLGFRCLGGIEGRCRRTRRPRGPVVDTLRCYNPDWRKTCVHVLSRHLF